MTRKTVVARAELLFQITHSFTHSHERMDEAPDWVEEEDCEESLPDDIAAEWMDEERAVITPVPPPRIEEKTVEETTEKSHEEKLREVMQNIAKSLSAPVPKEENTGWRGEETVEAESDDLIEKMRAGAAAAKKNAAQRRASDLDKYLLDLPPIDQESESMTFHDGSRFYVAKSTPQKPKMDDRMSPQIGKLLPKSIAELREELDDDARNKARRAIEESDGEKQKEIKKAATTLWVDKYAPSRFSELLSDARTNREMLRALKNWDPFVFERPAPKPPAAPEIPAWKKKRRYQFNNVSAASAKDDEQQQQIFGDDRRPLRRVILLAGEPGTGKTTLARVLAETAGYRVVEVNASDDRSQVSIERAVADAQTNRSLSKGRVSTKPACVVLDEIDGLDGKRAVAAIVDMATAAVEKKYAFAEHDDGRGQEDDESGDDDGDNVGEKRRQRTNKKQSNRKKKKGATPLTRPLICVCNDPYAQHLRPLRDISIFFHLKQPPTTHELVARLRAVAAAEGFSNSVSTTALQAVANAARGDIRACLHALQFAAHSGGSIDAALVTAASSGAVIDRVSGDFELWTKVLSRNRRGQLQQRATRLVAPTTTLNEGKTRSTGFVDSASVRLAELLGEIQGQEVDRFCAGIHENYLTDVDLLKCASAALEFSEADILYGAAIRGGRYDLAKFAAAQTCAAAYVECKVDRPPRMRPPKGNSAVFTRERDTNEAVFRALDEARSRWRRRSRKEEDCDDLPRTQSRLGSTACALDVAPILRRVIFDLQVRPVGIELMRPPERALVDETARTMASNGLSFERAPGDERHDWQLRPDILSATSFVFQGDDQDPLPPQKNHSRLAPITCQILSREVALSLVRDKEAARVEENGGDNSELADTKTNSASSPPRQSHQQLQKQQQKKKSPAEVIAENHREQGASSFSDGSLPTDDKKDHFSFTTWVVAKSKKMRKKASSLPHQQEGGDTSLLQELAASQQLGKLAVSTHFDKPHITFKFNKGFSDAVRRPVSVTDLLKD